MPTITFQPSGQRVSVEQETSILEAATGAALTSVVCCGITPACGECSLDVIEGAENLTPPDRLEQEHRKRMRFPPFRRLGCMALALGDVQVQLDR